MATDEQIDAAILSNVTVHWAKVAMVAAKSIDQLELPITDEAFERVCRRIEVLADGGTFDAQGDLARPRHSEVKLRRASHDA